MRAELRDGLEFLYSDSQVNRRPCGECAIDAARGSIASVHVLINDAPVGSTLRLALTRDGRPETGAAWHLLRHVPVEKNTGPVGFVEKGEEINPHVVRRAPFRVFDAMEPVRSSVRVPESVVALRLQLPVKGRPGPRQYELALHCGRERCELRLAIEVHGISVPPVGRDSFPYTNWFNLGNMAERHNLEPWSAPHWRMIRRYADLMAHARQNTFLLPLSTLFQMKQGQPVLDRARLRRLVKTFTDAGLYYIEGGHVAHRTGGEWEAATFDVGLAPGVRATSPEGNVLLAGMAAQLVDEIDRNDWSGRWIQHVTDEPTETNAVDYRILCGMVRRHLPGLPLMDATEDPTMAGSVDIWCPQAHQFQLHRDSFEAARAAGDRAWFYTCCFPGGPWLNRLLDEELLRPCLFGWGAALFDLQGFLHWGLNQYKSFQDPFEHSVVDHGGSNELPAGDTHIVYPGTNGPWSSVRLEAQREGCEDYELLRLLGRRDARRQRSIVRRVIKGFDRYTKRPATLRAARRDLLLALTQD